VKSAKNSPKRRSLAPHQLIGFAEKHIMVEPIAREYGAAQISLLGPCGRGDTGPDSDIDFRLIVKAIL